LFLLAPALIGIVTGICVSAASTVVERWALGQLAALPGLLPIVGASLALVVTLGVVVYVIRVATPSTAELYIITYHDPKGHSPLAVARQSCWLLRRRWVSAGRRGSNRHRS